MDSFTIQKCDDFLISFSTFTLTFHGGSTPSLILEEIENEYFKGIRQAIIRLEVSGPYGAQIQVLLCKNNAKMHRIVKKDLNFSFRLFSNLTVTEYNINSVRVNLI